MGTKNCPETPRQKMINMMYLVLTAMLALNVASETLQAFKIVDKSLMKTYLTFTDKNKTLLGDFRHAYEMNSDKVEKWMNLANEVNEHSDSMVSFLTETKELLAFGADGQVKLPGQEVTDEFPIIVTRDKDSIILKRQDDLNVSPVIMLTKGRGKELQDKINEYRAYLVDIVKDQPNIIANLKSSLDVDDPTRESMKLEKDQSMNFRTWPQQNFEATPVIASITLLSKLQIDVRNAESAVLRHLYNQIDAATFKFTGLKATVIPDASYIFQGQEYRARIFLSAEDSTQKLQVFMDGNNNSLPLEGNEAIFRMTPEEVKTYTYNGKIQYPTPDGEGFGTKPFSFEFQVAKPNATVSATKMNVLFKNLANPISISVPGVPNEKIKPVCTNGKMYKSGESWVIEPDQLDFNGDKTKVLVYAELDGKDRIMAEQKYRVMKVPDPVAKVGGIASGDITRDQLRLQRLVSATLENFYFEMQFVVTSFEMSVPGQGGMTTTLSSNSYYFSDEQKRLLNSLNTGDKVWIENIKAKIKDNDEDTERQLSPIILTVR